MVSRLITINVTKITAILKPVEFKKVNIKRKPTLVTRGDTSPVAVRPVSLVKTEPAPRKDERQKTHSHRFRQLLGNKKVIALVVVGCLVAGVLLRNASVNSDTDVKKPIYQTVLPKGKTIDELGGWKRVSPPKNDPVFAYTDMIDGVPISVSEQPLPQSFKNDTTGQVADLAKKFNATDKVAASSLDVYIGTSAKGPQSVIFAKNNLLVLIKSEKKVSDTSWAKYASLLN